jgi:hypothetical protein
VDTRRSAHLKLEDRVRDLISHPLLKEFAERLLPGDDNSRYYDIPLRRAGSLMPYHGHVVPAVVVEALNRMIDNAAAGETVFNEFYTEQEQQEDPTKRNTGLFFYRGKRGAPFAIICPGGGFEYVGTLHEGLPLASRISKKELNALTTLLPSRATRLDVYSRAPAYPTLRVKITTHTAEEKMTGWRELSVGVVATLLTLVALPRTSTGQVPLVGPRAEIITEPGPGSPK